MPLEKYSINKNDFASRQAELRRLHNIKQKDLAQLMGITRAYISGVESKGSDVSPGLNYIRGLRTVLSKEFNDTRTYDFLIDGIEFSTDSLQMKSAGKEAALLQSTLIAKEETIALLKEKIKMLEAEVERLKG